jgi:hypothetical protein
MKCLLLLLLQIIYLEKLYFFIIYSLKNYLLSLIL